MGRRCGGRENGEKGRKREGLPIKSLSWPYRQEEDTEYAGEGRGRFMRFFHTEVEVMT